MLRFPDLSTSIFG